ncbi:hypothetical protein [Aliishimia ponticola]|uniref:hypothetical protein n=1 Tax=Aliishimia ponticola TaxID=2499833 RepID=UPI0014560435|nr:hypothetical protein [Aliishimia ponticola]
MPRSVRVAALALAALAAVLGGVAGLRWAPLEETDVIDAVVQHHRNRTGGDGSDCFAVPGQGDVWLRVTCGASVYHVDRRGQRVPSPEPST